MLRLLGVVISIGLVDSLNPSTVGPALLLAAGEEPRRRVLAFTLGTFAVTFAGGLILILGPGRAIISLVPHPGPTARYILETIAGAALLTVGMVVWRRREQLRQRSGEPSQHKGLARRLVSRAARNPGLLGASIALVELPTAFPYFAAIAAVVGSGFGLTSQIVLVAVYNVCFVLPLLGIVLTLTVFGDRAVGILDRVRAYFRRRWPAVVGIAAIIAGAFVITLGVTGLTGRAGGPVGSVSRRVRHLISH
ncbi:MAG: GAP family protein [Solirubrobacterales bacterium]|nr:GAP family protein [Solirubrobacterales bacterium]